MARERFCPGRLRVSQSSKVDFTNLPSYGYYQKQPAIPLVEAASLSHSETNPCKVILRGISVSDFTEEIMSHFGESPVQLTPQTVVKPMSVSLAEGVRPVNAGSGLDSREVSLEAPAGTPARHRISSSATKSGRMVGATTRRSGSPRITRSRWSAATSMRPTSSTRCKAASRSSSTAMSRIPG